MSTTTNQRRTLTAPTLLRALAAVVAAAALVLALMVTLSPLQLLALAFLTPLAIALLVGMADEWHEPGQVVLEQQRGQR